MSGIICSDEDYARSLNDSSITCLTRSGTIGVVLTVESGFVSLLAVVYIFILIGRTLYLNLRQKQSWLKVFRQPMDLLMFSLFLADAVQAIGMILSLRWVAAGKVEVGSFCAVQGVTKIVGATTVAFSTAGISILTFISVWMRKTVSSMKATLTIIIGFWIFAALLAIVALGLNHDQKFIVPTPYWCWVGHHFIAWRLLSEYVWMWLALLISVLVYIPLYLWMRGNIELDPLSWWKPRFKYTSERDRHVIAVRRRSLHMLAYPLLYTLCIMPLSIVRWMVFVQEAVFGASRLSPTPTFIAVSIFGLSGFFNAILLLTTRRRSGLFGEFSVKSRSPIVFLRDEPDVILGSVRDMSKTLSRIDEH